MIWGKKVKYTHNWGNEDVSTYTRYIRPYRYAMYNARACTIGCVPRSRKGRIREIRSTFQSVLSGFSHSVRNASLPVSLRSFVALIPRSLGAKVSLKKKKPITCMPASTMDVAQNTHRQVVFSAIKPPAKMYRISIIHVGKWGVQQASRQSRDARDEAE
jgi:hypothetical protein